MSVLAYQEVTRRIEELSRCVYELDPYFVMPPPPVEDPAATLAMLVSSGEHAQQQRRGRSPERRELLPPKPRASRSPAWSLGGSTYAEIVKGCGSRSSSTSERLPSAQRLTMHRMPFEIPDTRRSIEPENINSIGASPNKAISVVQKCINSEDVSEASSYGGYSESEIINSERDKNLHNEQLQTVDINKQLYHDQLNLNQLIPTARHIYESKEITSIKSMNTIVPVQDHERSISPSAKQRSHDLSYAEILALGLRKPANTQIITTLPKPQVAQVESVQNTIFEVEKSPETQSKSLPRDPKVKINKPKSTPLRHSNETQKHRKPSEKHTHSQEVQLFKKKKSTKKVIEVEYFDDTSEQSFTEEIPKPIASVPTKLPQDVILTKPQAEVENIESSIDIHQTKLNEHIQKRNIPEVKKTKKKNKIKHIEDDVEKALKEIEHVNQNKKKKTKVKHVSDGKFTIEASGTKAHSDTVSDSLISDIHISQVIKNKSKEIFKIDKPSDTFISQLVSQEDLNIQKDEADRSKCLEKHFEQQTDTSEDIPLMVASLKLDTLKDNMKHKKKKKEKKQQTADQIDNNVQSLDIVAPIHIINVDDRSDYEIKDDGFNLSTTYDSSLINKPFIAEEKPEVNINSLTLSNTRTVGKPLTEKQNKIDKLIKDKSDDDESNRTREKPRERHSESPKIQMPISNECLIDSIVSQEKSVDETDNPCKSLTDTKNIVSVDWVTLMEEDDEVNNSSQLKRMSNENLQCKELNLEFASEITILEETFKQAEVPSTVKSNEEESQSWDSDIERENIKEYADSPAEQNNNNTLYNCDSEKEIKNNVGQEMIQYEPIIQEQETHTVYLITHEEKKMPPIRKVRVFRSKSSSIEEPTENEDKNIKDEYCIQNDYQQRISIAESLMDFKNADVEKRGSFDIHKENEIIDNDHSNVEQAIFGSIKDRQQSVSQSNIPYEALVEDKDIVVIDKNIYQSKFDFDLINDNSKNLTKYLAEDFVDIPYSELRDAEYILGLTASTIDVDEQYSSNNQNLGTHEEENIFPSLVLDSTEISSESYLQTSDSLAINVDSINITINNEKEKDSNSSNIHKIEKNCHNYAAISDAENLYAKIKHKSLNENLNLSIEKFTDLNRTSMELSERTWQPSCNEVLQNEEILNKNKKLYINTFEAPKYNYHEIHDSEKLFATTKAGFKNITPVDIDFISSISTVVPQSDVPKYNYHEIADAECLSALKENPVADMMQLETKTQLDCSTNMADKSLQNKSIENEESEQPYPCNSQLKTENCKQVFIQDDTKPRDIDQNKIDLEDIPKNSRSINISKEGHSDTKTLRDHVQNFLESEQVHATGLTESFGSLVFYNMSTETVEQEKVVDKCDIVDDAGRTSPRNENTVESISKEPVKSTIVVIDDTEEKLCFDVQVENPELLRDTEESINISDMNTVIEKNENKTILPNENKEEYKNIKSDLKSQCHDKEDLVTDFSNPVEDDKENKTNVRVDIDVSSKFYEIDTPTSYHMLKEPSTSRPEKSPIHSLHDLLPEIDSIPEFKPACKSQVLYSNLSADAPEFTPSYLFKPSNINSTYVKSTSVTLTDPTTNINKDLNTVYYDETNYRNSVQQQEYPQKDERLASDSIVEVKSNIKEHCLDLSECNITDQSKLKLHEDKQNESITSDTALTDICPSLSNVWMKASEDGKSYAKVLVEGLTYSDESDYDTCIKSCKIATIANEDHILKSADAFKEEFINKNDVSSSWAKIVASNVPDNLPIQEIVMKDNVKAQNKPPVIILDKSESEKPETCTTDLEIDSEGFITVDRNKRSRSRSRDISSPLQKERKVKENRDTSRNRFNALSDLNTDDSNTVLSIKKIDDNKIAKKVRKGRMRKSMEKDIVNQSNVKEDIGNSSNNIELEKMSSAPTELTVESSPENVYLTVDVKRTDAQHGNETVVILPETKKKNKKKKKDKKTSQDSCEASMESLTSNIQEVVALTKENNNTQSEILTPELIRTPIKERIYSEAQFWKSEPTILSDPGNVSDTMTIEITENNFKKSDDNINVTINKEVTKRSQENQSEHKISPEQSLENKMADLQREIEEMLLPDSDNSIICQSTLKKADSDSFKSSQNFKLQDNSSPELNYLQPSDILTPPDINKSEVQLKTNLKSSSQSFNVVNKNDIEFYRISDVGGTENVNIVPYLDKNESTCISNLGYLKLDSFWVEKFAVDDAEKLFASQKSQIDIEIIVDSNNISKSQNSFTCLEYNNNLNTDILADKTFWVDKHLYDDAESLYYASMAKKTKTIDSTDVKEKSDDRNDKDRGPNGSGYSSDVEKTSQQRSFDLSSDSNYISMDLPGGICSWKDENSYLSLQIPPAAIEPILSDKTSSIDIDISEDILTTLSLEPDTLTFPVQEPFAAEAARNPDKDTLSNDIDTLFDEVKIVQANLTELPDESLEAMELGLVDGISILVNCEKAATLLEQKIMEYHHEDEVQALLKEIIVIKTRISKLLVQARKGVAVIQEAKTVIEAQNIKLEEDEQKIFKLDSWLETINNDLQETTKQSNVLTEDDIFKYLTVYERYIQEYSEYEVILKSITVINFGDSSQIGKKLSVTKRMLEETKYLVIAEVERLKQILIQIRTAPEIIDDDLSQTDRTIDSTSMPEEIVTPRENIVKPKFVDEIEVENKHDGNPVINTYIETLHETQKQIVSSNNMETQTGKSLLSESPSVADKSTTCQPEKTFTSDVAITCAPAQNVEIQTNDNLEQSDNNLLQNIKIRQTSTKDYDTIEIASQPIQKEQITKKDSIVINADYKDKANYKDSQLNIIHSVPESFETILVEPDETTTEVIVEPDGTKKIIVKKIKKTLIKRQHVVNQGENPNTDTLNTNEQISKITLVDEKRSFSNIDCDETIKHMQYESFGSNIISGIPDSEVTIQEITSKPDMIISMEKNLEPDEIIQMVDDQIQPTIHTSSASITAVVQKITKRIVKTKRRIIQRVTIIDGKEHVSEEIIEEPDDIEESEMQVPRVLITVKESDGIKDNNEDMDTDHDNKSIPFSPVSINTDKVSKAKDDTILGSTNILKDSINEKTPGDLQDSETKCLVVEECKVASNESGTVAPHNVRDSDLILSDVKLEEFQTTPTFIATEDISDSNTAMVIQKVTKKITRTKKRIIEHINIVDGKESITQEIIEEPDDVEIIEEPILSQAITQQNDKAKKITVLRRVQLIDGKEHITEQIIEESDNENIPQNTVAPYRKSSNILECERPGLTSVSHHELTHPQETKFLDDSLDTNEKQTTSNEPKNITEKILGQIITHVGSKEKESVKDREISEEPRGFIHTDKTKLDSQESIDLCTTLEQEMLKEQSDLKLHGSNIVTKQITTKITNSRKRIIKNIKIIDGQEYITDEVTEEPENIEIIEGKPIISEITSDQNLNTTQINILHQDSQLHTKELDDSEIVDKKYDFSLEKPSKERSMLEEPDLSLTTSKGVELPMEFIQNYKDDINSKVSTHKDIPYERPGNSNSEILYIDNECLNDLVEPKNMGDLKNKIETPIQNTNLIETKNTIVKDFINISTEKENLYELLEKDSLETNSSTKQEAVENVITINVECTSKTNIDSEPDFVIEVKNDKVKEFSTLSEFTSKSTLSNKEALPITEHDTDSLQKDVDIKNMRQETIIMDTSKALISENLLETPDVSAKVDTIKHISEPKSQINVDSSYTKNLEEVIPTEKNIDNVPQDLIEQKTVTELKTKTFLSDNQMSQRATQTFISSICEFEDKNTVPMQVQNTEYEDCIENICTEKLRKIKNEENQNLQDSHDNIESKDKSHVLDISLSLAKPDENKTQEPTVELDLKIEDFGTKDVSVVKRDISSNLPFKIKITEEVKLGNIKQDQKHEGLHKDLSKDCHKTLLTLDNKSNDTESFTNTNEDISVDRQSSSLGHYMEIRTPTLEDSPKPAADICITSGNSGKNESLSISAESKTSIASKGYEPEDTSLDVEDLPIDKKTKRHKHKFKKTSEDTVYPEPTTSEEVTPCSSFADAPVHHKKKTKKSKKRKATEPCTDIVKDDINSVALENSRETLITPKDESYITISDTSDINTVKVIEECIGSSPENVMENITTTITYPIPVIETIETNEFCIQTSPDISMIETGEKNISIHPEPVDSKSQTSPISVKEVLSQTTPREENENYTQTSENFTLVENKEFKQCEVQTSRDESPVPVEKIEAATQIVLRDIISHHENFSQTVSPTEEKNESPVPEFRETQTSPIHKLEQQEKSTEVIIETLDSLIQTDRHAIVDQETSTSLDDSKENIDISIQTQIIPLVSSSTQSETMHEVPSRKTSPSSKINVLTTDCSQQTTPRAQVCELQNENVSDISKMADSQQQTTPRSEYLNISQNLNLDQQTKTSDFLFSNKQGTSEMGIETEPVFECFDQIQQTSPRVFSDDSMSTTTDEPYEVQVRAQISIPDLTNKFLEDEKSLSSQDDMKQKRRKQKKKTVSHLQSSESLSDPINTELSQSLSPISDDIPSKDTSSVDEGIAQVISPIIQIQQHNVIIPKLSYSDVVQRSKSKSPSPIKIINSSKSSKAKLLETLQKRTKSTQKSKTIADPLTLALLEPSVEKSYDLIVSRELEEVKNALKCNDSDKMESSVVVVIETISIWLEEIQYKINNNIITSVKSSDETERIKVLEGYISNLKEIICVTEVNEEIITLIETLTSQIFAVYNLSNQSVTKLEEVENLCGKFSIDLDKLCESVNQVQLSLDNLIVSEIPILKKLDSLDKFESENEEHVLKIKKMFQDYRSLVNVQLKREYSLQLYMCDDSSKKIENIINTERDRLLQLAALTEEYEQTLQDFGQIIDVAEALLDGKIIISNKDHLYEEIQKHRKFFVNLSHCRAILESLEDNLDAETRAKYSTLHHSLHDRATSIIDRATSRAQHMTLAASRWSLLEHGMKEEQQWLGVAQQRIPDLTNVTSMDHEQYLNLYQSISLDVSQHYAKMLRLISITESLQGLIVCSGLETECSLALNTLLKLQEEVNSNLTRLIAFKENWSTYDILIDRIEGWIKLGNRELENITPENITTTNNLRRFWELKAQHEVYANLKNESGIQFDKALEILPISDEMVQRQYFSKVEDRWRSLSKRIANLHSAAILNISDRDVSTGEKLHILDDELRELRAMLDSLKGVIKSDDELNLYIERLQVMTDRIDRIQNELGRLSLLPTAESDQLGALLSQSGMLNDQIAEELERSVLLKEKIVQVRAGIARCQKSQRRAKLSLEECEAAERLGSDVVERSSLTCDKLMEDLSSQWKDILALRQALHTLPTSLRVCVSPLSVERDISALQEIHADLETACNDLSVRLRARLQLWRRFERQLELVQGAVREADYMVELLTVQGQVDYDRLLKATEKLETLSESLSHRSGELVGSLRSAAEPLQANCEATVASQLQRELDDATAAYEHTCANLTHMCDKYQKAVELWKRYRDAAAAVRAFTEQQEGDLPTLRPDDASATAQACLEQEARVAELRSLAARVAAETGSRALQSDADALARRLQLVAGAVQTLADLGEARHLARTKAQNAKEKFCDMRQDLTPVTEEGDIIEDKLIALRKNLISLGKSEADIAPAKAELPDIDRDVSEEHSIVRILELWQAMFRDTFLHYHRLSTVLVRSGDAATALKLWHEYLLDLQSFLSGSVPADYENLTEHRRLCRVHRNLLASQRSVLVNENKEIKTPNLSDKFNTLTNMHNETLARIVERHDDVCNRIAVWDDYKNVYTDLLQWLKETEREKEKLQLRYIHMKRIQKILFNIQNLLDKLPEGRTLSEKLLSNLRKVLVFTDDTYGASVRMEYSGLVKRVDNLQASLDTWRDFLNRILGLIGEYNNLTSDLNKLYTKTQSEVASYTDDDRLSRPQLRKSLEKYTDLRSKINKTEKQLEALSVIQEQLKECLSPQDIRIVNQRIWQHRQQQADLEHQISIIINRIQERLEIFTMFDSRVTRFFEWITLLESRLETSSTTGETASDPQSLIKRIISDIQSETALKEREFEWLNETGTLLIDVSKKDEKSYSKNISKHLKAIQERWHRLQETGRNKVAKINELLETILQLEERLTEIRLKLHTIESQLSSSAILETLTTKAVDAQFQARDEIHKDIEIESEELGKTLNLCELVFNDPEVIKGNFDLRNLRTGVEIVEKKWKNICDMSEHRKNTLKEIRKSAELSSSLLPKVEKKLDLIEKRVEKIEIRKRHGEAEDETVSQALIRDIDGLVDDTKRLEDAYSRIASARGMELRGSAADDAARLRASVRRRQQLRGRVDAAGADAYRQFVAAHGITVVALAEADVRLTRALHLAPTPLDKKTTLLELKGVEEDLHECRTLVKNADRLALAVSSLNGVSDMVAEYRALLQDVRARLELAHAEVIRDVDTAVQVDTLKWETDAELQVDTLTSKETYRLELGAAVDETSQALEILRIVLLRKIQDNTNGDELATAAKEIAKAGAKPGQTLELAKHLSELLLTECDATEDEAMLKEVESLSLKYEDLLNQAKKRELQINNLRLPHSASYALTCEHEPGRLTCPLCSDRNWKQLDNDLWRLEQWLQFAEAMNEARTNPPEEYDALEDAIQDHREFLLDLDSHKSLVVSLNVVGTHVTRHASDADAAERARVRLAAANSRWDVACTRAGAWQTRLQAALVHNRQFHDAVVELVAQLSAAERLVRAREPLRLTRPAAELRRDFRRFSELRDELSNAEPRVLALRDAAHLLRATDEQDLYTRLGELRLRLQSLRKLSAVYALKLGAALARAPASATTSALAAAAAAAAPQLMEEDGEQMSATNLPPLDDTDVIARDESEERELSRLRRGLRFVGRVARASLPFQALLLLLLGAAALAPHAPSDCRAPASLAPVLRYPHGPPPL